EIVHVLWRVRSRGACGGFAGRGTSGGTARSGASFRRLSGMKSALRQLCFVLALAVILWPPVSRAAKPVEGLLEQAEQKRSSNPAAFRELLTRLNALADSATPLERQRIAYLNAYQQSITGHLDESIRQARRLIAQTR